MDLCSCQRKRQRELSELFQTVPVKEETSTNTTNGASSMTDDITPVPKRVKTVDFAELVNIMDDRDDLLANNIPTDDVILLVYRELDELRFNQHKTKVELLANVIRALCYVCRDLKVNGAGVMLQCFNDLMQRNKRRLGR